MADVQPDKVIRIATNLFEAIYRFGLSEREYTVLLCIIRWTYGFNRKQHPLSLGFIQTDTGITRGHISEILKKLECQNIVIIRKSNGRVPQEISLQKDFEKWVNCSRIGNCSRNSNCSQIGNNNCYQNGNSDCSRIGNQDKTIYIYDNIDKTIYISSNHVLTGSDSEILAKPDYDSEFEEIWKVYPRKVGKKVAKDKYVKARTRKKAPVSFETVKHGVECYAEEMKDTPPKYIKHGDAWMNQECWIDYAEQGATDIANKADEETGGKKWQ